MMHLMSHICLNIEIEMHFDLSHRFELFLFLQKLKMKLHLKATVDYTHTHRSSSLSQVILLLLILFSFNLENFSLSQMSIHCFFFVIVVFAFGSCPASRVRTHSCVQRRRSRKWKQYLESPKPLSAFHSKILAIITMKLFVAGQIKCKLACSMFDDFFSLTRWRCSKGRVDRNVKTTFSIQILLTTAVSYTSYFII